MSSIKLSPNASGTGIFTIAAPNSNTDRTLTLPDQTGTVLTNAGPFTANASASAGAVTIDASNNVGIGTSSPNRRLHVQNGSSGASNYGVPGLAIESSTNVDLQMMGSTTGQLGITFSDSGNNQAGFIYYQNNGDYMQFATNGSERARIDSSGNLLVGTTSVFNSARAVFRGVQGSLSTLGCEASGTGGQYQIIFSNSNGLVGRIETSGSSTSYVTSSDYRLKEQVAPMTGALAKVAALKPCTYKWKADGSDGEGFIAHELAEVCPRAVSGEKDAVNEDGSIKPQGIDTSFLVATLTAAIQEQQALIESLTARIAALEAQP